MCIRDSYWSRPNLTDIVDLPIGLDFVDTLKPRKFKWQTRDGNIKDGERIDDLRLVLGAFSCRNRAIGYCQAMNYIVARLLMIGEPEDAFWVLCAICEDIFPGYWVPSMTGVQADLKVLEDLKRGSITPSEQNHSLATYCTKISKDDSLIDFKDSASVSFETS